MVMDNFSEDKDLQIYLFWVYWLIFCYCVFAGSKLDLSLIVQTIFLVLSSFICIFLIQIESVLWPFLQFLTFDAPFGTLWTFFSLLVHIYCVPTYTLLSSHIVFLCVLIAYSWFFWYGFVKFYLYHSVFCVCPRFIFCPCSVLVPYMLSIFVLRTRACNFWLLYKVYLTLLIWFYCSIFLFIHHC